MKIATPILINAAAMAMQHPDSFHRPADAELEGVAGGSVVKVVCDAERFWVRVESRKAGVITGRVANNLLLFTPLEFGQRIRFHVDNIFEGLLVNAVVEAMITANPELARNYSREALAKLVDDFLERLASNARVERAGEE